MSLQDDLFATASAPRTEHLADQTVLLRGRALADAGELLQALNAIVRAAPFRHMHTPGGFRMSVAMSNCGDWGWISDRRGYRYTREDPDSGRAWPGMPPVLRALSQAAAAEAGFADFQPDACLINRYEPGARMTLHQDRNERDFSAPIVSISLGLPAVFQLGGAERKDRAQRVPLCHGDILVWGGADRLRFHGVLPLKAGHHPQLGAMRINLTLRKAA
ncbi:MAG: DNA oxidative demethylase AlkB [Nevskiaceae bacterium]|nr:MAG: DNA oxidative demethylase AlkB [Nevskiaceae bacterium]